MRKLPAVAVALALSSSVVGQQSIVKKCESRESHSRVEDNQPIPDQLKIPDAPETAQEIGCFTSLSKNSTMVDVVRKCGIPDRHLGSGLYIFGYYMNDCSVVSVSTPELQRLVMKHVKHGEGHGSTEQLVIVEKSP